MKMLDAILSFVRPEIATLAFFLCEKIRALILLLSSITCRYHGRVGELSNYFSEHALIKYRVMVEVEYFIELCGLLPQLSGVPKDKVRITTKLLLTTIVRCVVTCLVVDMLFRIRFTLSYDKLTPCLLIIFVLFLALPIGHDCLVLPH